MMTSNLILKRLTNYYWPMVASEVAVSVVPFINTLMMGHLGINVLAAGGLVDACFAFILVLFWGIFSTSSTLIARYRGTDQEFAIARVFKSALILSMALSIPVMLIFASLAQILVWLDQSTALIDLARPYLYTLSPAILPDFLLMSLYHFFFGIGKPKMVLFASVALAPMTILFNYLFMYGKLGLPELGVSGAGVGTSIAYSLLTAGLLVAVFKGKEFQPYLKSSRWFYWKEAKELLRVGVPVGLVWITEIGFFTAVAFLMGVISTVSLAAHQIAYQAYLLIFITFAYTMGQAVQMVIAEQLASKNIKEIERTYWLAFCYLGFILLILSAGAWLYPLGLVYLNLGDQLVPSSALTQLSISLLRIMPVFLLLDSLGFLTFSGLRAFKDTSFSLGAVVSIYWIVLIPILSVGVVHFHAFSPEHLWWALCFGSLLSLILQFLRFRYRLKKLGLPVVG